MKKHKKDAESTPAESLNSHALVRRLLRLTWNYRWACLGLTFIQVAVLAMTLSGLSFMGLGIDFIRHALDGSAKPPQWPFGLGPPAHWTPAPTLLAIAAGVLAFAAVRLLLNVAHAIASSWLIQMRIVVDVRARVYAAMQRLSFRFFDSNTSSSVINRVTSDVQLLRMFIDDVLMQGFILILSLTIYLVYMATIDWRLTLACLASTPILWLVTSRFSRIVQPAYDQNRTLFDTLILRLVENVQGAHVVKAFALEDNEVAKFSAANREVRDQKDWIFRQTAFFQPFIHFLTNVNIIVMLAYGGFLVIRYEQTPDPIHAAHAGLSIGQLLVFAGLLQRFSDQVAGISNIATSLQQSLTGARRVFEVLDTPVEIVSPPTPVPFPPSGGRVTFEHVSFGYQSDRPALIDIHMEVAPGECVAILGATGSGKSTLLSLIPRFYDPNAGRILIDGIDTRHGDLHALRRRVGFVFQESFLFSHTVAANIAYGRTDATPAQIEAAARLACAHDFIAQLPQGYDTVLHESGSNLSGGQRQRLAIARALILEPAILLLDDPTAAVDPGTEDEILVALDQAMKGRTTFIVTNRLSVLRRVSRVMLLEDGRLVHAGPHARLLQVSEQYRRTVRCQSPDMESCRLLGEEYEALLRELEEEEERARRVDSGPVPLLERGA